MKNRRTRTSYSPSKSVKLGATQHFCSDRNSREIPYTFQIILFNGYQHVFHPFTDFDVGQNGSRPFNDT